MKRTLCLILAVLLTLPFSGCANNNTNNPVPQSTESKSSEEQTTNVPQTEELDESEKRAQISDNLPDTELNGFQLNIMTREGFEKEVFVTSENSVDVIDEAVYKRVQDIEDRFDCKLNVIVKPQDPNGFKNAIRTSVSGDDNMFHVAIGHIDYVASLAPDGFLMPWNEIQYIDFEQPWWNQSAIDTLTIGGNTYFALGDMNYTLIMQTNCIYFNKEYVKDYQIETPYTTVLEGNWTLDYLSNVTKNIYSDLNHNEERDIGDLYGFTVDVHSGLNSLQNATDNLMYAKDKDGIPYFNANTERMATLVEKVYSLLYENVGTFAAYEYSYTDGEQTVYWWSVSSTKYNNGTTVFTLGWLGNATNVYRNSDHEYGIIPLPKFDESQENYHTMMDASGPFMCLPMSLKDSDTVGLLIEAMAAYGYKYITPVVFDTALKHKYARDDETGIMLDMIIDGLTFDFGYVHSSDYHNLLRKIMNKRQNSLASYLGSAQSGLEKYYQRIIDKYLDN